jgi:fatty acid synthase
MAGGSPMYERPSGRRFDHDGPGKVREAAMLLDPAARVRGDGEY